MQPLTRRSDGENDRIGEGGVIKEDGGIVKMQRSGRAPFHAAAGARGSCVNAGVQSGKSLKSPRPGNTPPRWMVSK